MKKLVIWGAAGHALVAADIARATDEYEIVGYIDDVNPHQHGRPFGGARILGGRDQLGRLHDEGVQHAIVAVGDCRARVQLGRVTESLDFVLATLVHPRAIVARDVALGAGTLVAAGSVIGTGTAVGKNVIVNTGATIDHQCQLGDGCHLGPAAHTGGLVQVGGEAWIGIGAIIKDRVSIGAGSIVGAGAVVLRDIPDHVMAYGIPARVIRAL